MFYRTSRFLQNGIKPIYVFDGKPPKFKSETLEKRAKNKKEAEEKWKKALDEERYEDARKYAQATSRLTQEMVVECKELLTAFGIPFVQAISEGEAQSAIMAQKQVVDAASSQDYDSLLFAAPKLLRNLTLSGRRKVPRQNRYVIVEPEEIKLDEVLSKNEIDLDKLIWIGLMCGTDFNPGIKRVGPKTALKIVKQCDSFDSVKKLIKEKYNQEFVEHVDDVIEFFKNPPYLEVEKLEFNRINKEKVMEILCENHDFSTPRVDKTLTDLQKVADEILGQSKLDKWF